MRKFLLTGLLVILMLSLMVGVAVAGGWTSIDYSASHDPDDTIDTDGIAIWNPDEASPDESPHGNFSSTSNYCRVCHAVHLAGAGSWRLLADGTANGGTSRLTECDFCHGITGATEKRPYRPKDYDVRGEHTLGSTIIPDEASGSGTLGTGGLSCGDCHTVHGGGSMALEFVGGDQTDWDTKILRNDPNKDNNVLADGVTGAASTETADGKMSNFCADCHNLNPNWNLTEDPSVDSTRANGMSHVQGPTAEGSLEVYGTTMAVAGWGTIDGGLAQDTTSGCRGCHAASNEGNDSGSTTESVSAFPHQSIGSKLLFDSFTEDSTIQTAADTAYIAGGQINDASRVLPNMDQLCGKCHIEGGDIDAASVGVGQTF